MKAKPPTIPFTPNTNVPAYGVMELFNSTLIRDTRVFNARQVSGGYYDDGQVKYVINGPFNTTADTYGSCVLGDYPTMAVVAANTSFNVGDVCGPLANSWGMSPKGGGFTCLSASNANTGLVCVALSGEKHHFATLSANLSFNSTTGVNATLELGCVVQGVLPPSTMTEGQIDANTDVLIAVVNTRWYVVLAPCD